jgi:thymidylate synthase
MNNLDARYQGLLEDILYWGVEKKDRTGTGTISVFGRQIRHKMSDGFPLLTTKKMAWKTMVTELLWFLRGDTNIKFLVDNDCHIWDGDAYKNYCKHYDSLVNSDPPQKLSKEQFIAIIEADDEFAKTWGELGPIYGKQWRKWQGWVDIPDVHRLAKGSIWFDQIQRLIYMIKNEPDSRRLMVSSWNVAELDQMVLPPCHYGFQVYTRELSLEERHSMVSRVTDKMTPTDLEGKEWIIVDNMPYKIPTRGISLMWNQRSVDTFLGLPFNIASYGLLLTLLAKEVNMIPDELICNLGDTHLYLNHIEQAKEQISRDYFELPQVELNFDFKYMDGYKILWDEIKVSDINLINYQSHPAIKAPLSN